MEANTLEQALKQKGVLSKRGDKGPIKLWQDRFFVIEDGYKLVYYVEELDIINKKASKGFINLKEIEKIVSADKHEFTLEVPGRSYFLRAEDSFDKDKWIADLTIITKSLRESSQKDLRASADTVFKRDDSFKDSSKKPNLTSSAILGRQNSSTQDGLFVASKSFVPVTKRFYSSLVIPKEDLTRSSQKINQGLLPVEETENYQEKQKQKQKIDSYSNQSQAQHTPQQQHEQVQKQTQSYENEKRNSTVLNLKILHEVQEIFANSSSLSEMKQNRKLEKTELSTMSHLNNYKTHIQEIAENLPKVTEKKPLISYDIEPPQKVGNTQSLFQSEKEWSNNQASTAKQLYSSRERTPEKNSLKPPLEGQTNGLQKTNTTMQTPNTTWQTTNSTWQTTNSTWQTANTTNPSQASKPSGFFSTMGKIRNFICCTQSRRMQSGPDVFEVCEGPVGACDKCKKPCSQIRIFRNEPCKHAICADCISKLFTGDFYNCPIFGCSYKLMIKELTDFSDISSFGGDSMALYKLEEANSKAAKW